MMGLNPPGVPREVLREIVPPISPQVGGIPCILPGSFHGRNPPMNAHILAWAPRIPADHTGPLLSCFWEYDSSRMTGSLYGRKVPGMKQIKPNYTIQHNDDPWYSRWVRESVF